MNSLILHLVVWTFSPETLFVACKQHMCKRLPFVKCHCNKFGHMYIIFQRGTEQVGLCLTFSERKPVFYIDGTWHQHIDFITSKLGQD